MAWWDAWPQYASGSEQQRARLVGDFERWEPEQEQPVPPVTVAEVHAFEAERAAQWRGPDPAGLPARWPATALQLWTDITRQVERVRQAPTRTRQIRSAPAGSGNNAEWTQSAVPAPYQSAAAGGADNQGAWRSRPAPNHPRSNDVSSLPANGRAPVTPAHGVARRLDKPGFRNPDIGFLVIAIGKQVIQAKYKRTMSRADAWKIRDALDQALRHGKAKPRQEQHIDDIRMRQGQNVDDLYGNSMPDKRLAVGEVFKETGQVLKNPVSEYWLLAGNLITQIGYGRPLSREEEKIISTVGSIADTGLDVAYRPAMVGNVVGTVIQAAGQLIDSDPLTPEGVMEMLTNLNLRGLERGLDEPVAKSPPADYDPGERQEHVAPHDTAKISTRQEERWSPKPDTPAADPEFQLHYKDAAWVKDAREVTLYGIPYAYVPELGRLYRKVRVNAETADAGTVKLDVLTEPVSMPDGRTRWQVVGKDGKQLPEHVLFSEGSKTEGMLKLDKPASEVSRWASWPPQPDTPAADPEFQLHYQNAAWVTALPEFSHEGITYAYVRDPGRYYRKVTVWFRTADGIAIQFAVLTEPVARPDGTSRLQVIGKNGKQLFGHVALFRGSKNLGVLESEQRRYQDPEWLEFTSGDGSHYVYVPHLRESYRPVRVQIETADAGTIELDVLTEPVSMPDGTTRWQVVDRDGKHSSGSFNEKESKNEGALEQDQPQAVADPDAFCAVPPQKDNGQYHPPGRAPNDLAVRVDKRVGSGPPTLECLPEDVMRMIVNYLPDREVGRMRQTSTRFRNMLAQENQIRAARRVNQLATLHERMEGIRALDESLRVRPLEVLIGRIEELPQVERQEALALIDTAIGALPETYRERPRTAFDNVRAQEEQISAALGVTDLTALRERMVSIQALGESLRVRPLEALIGRIADLPQADRQQAFDLILLPPDLHQEFDLLLLRVDQRQALDLIPNAIDVLPLPHRERPLAALANQLDRRTEIWRNVDAVFHHDPQPGAGPLATHANYRRIADMTLDLEEQYQAVPFAALANQLGMLPEGLRQPEYRRISDRAPFIASRQDRAALLTALVNRLDILPEGLRQIEYQRIFDMVSVIEPPQLRNEPLEALTLQIRLLSEDRRWAAFTGNMAEIDALPVDDPWIPRHLFGMYGQIDSLPAGDRVAARRLVDNAETLLRMAPDVRQHYRDPGWIDQVLISVRDPAAAVFHSWTRPDGTVSEQGPYWLGSVRFGPDNPRNVLLERVDVGGTTRWYLVGRNDERLSQYLDQRYSGTLTPDNLRRNR